jgi:hypothetical protein
MPLHLIRHRSLLQPVPDKLLANYL